MSPVKPIPDNYPRVVASLVLDGAAKAIDFYTDIFGFTVRGGVMTGPDGKVGHAELELGDSLIMLADEYPDMGYLSPKAIGGTPVTLLVYVEDVDATFDRAIKAGAKSTRAVQDQFYGDRSGQLEDPWGHHWSLATHIEDVPPEEMEKRAAQMMSEGS